MTRPNIFQLIFKDFVLANHIILKMGLLSAILISKK